MGSCVPKWLYSASYQCPVMDVLSEHCLLLSETNQKGCRGFTMGKITNIVCGCYSGHGNKTSCMVLLWMDVVENLHHGCLAWFSLSRECGHVVERNASIAMTVSNTKVILYSQEMIIG